MRETTKMKWAKRREVFNKVLGIPDAADLLDESLEALVAKLTALGIHHKALNFGTKSESIPEQIERLAGYAKTAGLSEAVVEALGRVLSESQLEEVLERLAATVDDNTGDKPRKKKPTAKPAVRGGAAIGKSLTVDDFWVTAQKSKMTPNRFWGQKLKVRPEAPQRPTRLSKFWGVDLNS